MKNILFTKHFNEKIEEDVNVILSPQYYWIKRIDIPIKTIKEAKKISPSILKLNDKEFYFDAVKIDNDFYAIAIRKDLNLPIDKKYIKSLRIAQCEFKNVECLNLPNNFSLQKVNGIFFCFPGHKENCICVDNLLNKIELSNCTFNLFDVLNISKKELYLLFISFSLFIFMFVSKFVVYSVLEHKLKEKFNNLKQYHLPLTNIQLDSLINNYKKEILAQKKLRNYIKIIQKIKLLDNEYIEHFSFSDNILKIIIVSKRNFDFILKNNHLKFKSYMKKDKYEVKIYVK